jgi:hypothetical protein
MVSHHSLAQHTFIFPGKAHDHKNLPLFQCRFQFVRFAWFCGPGGWG